MFTAEEPREYERLIEDMAHVGCTVSWSKTCLWIGGNTYPIRDILKKNHWKWSPKKKQWYMSTAQYMGKNPPKNGKDYALMGTAADGTSVVVAECHHDEPVWDLDYLLGY